MADLSQRDKEILLGQNRETNARIEALQADENSPEKKLATRESQKMTAAFVIITGLALLLSGFFLNGSQFGFEKSLGAVIVVVGVAWYVWLRADVRKLRNGGAQHA